MNVVKTQILKYLYDFGSQPEEISNFSLGSIEFHALKIAGGTSTAQLQVSNDQTNWTNGTTAAVVIGATAPAKYFTQIASADLSYRYIRIYFTHSTTPGPLTTFECVQKIIAKTV